MLREIHLMFALWRLLCGILFGGCYVKVVILIYTLLTLKLMIKGVVCPYWCPTPTLCEHWIMSLSQFCRCQHANVCVVAVYVLFSLYIVCGVWWWLI